MREIDALIAEKVMGFNVRAEGRDHVGPCYSEGGFHEEPVPHYSTDIAAAWQVVEKLSLPNPDNILEADNYPPIKINAVIRLNDGRWMARFDEAAELQSYYERDCYTDEMAKRSYAVAETPALAICLAALKAACHPIQEPPL